LKCIHTARESLTGRASLRLRHQIDTGIAGEHAVIERVRDLDRGSAGLIGNSFVSSWNAISPEGLSILEDFMGNPSNIVSMPFDRRVLWAGKVAVGSGQDTIVITGLTHYSDPEYVQAFAFQGNEKPRRIPANSNPEKNLKAHRIIIGFESMAELKFEYYDTGQRYMLSADVEEMPHAELEGLLKIGAIPNVQRSPSAFHLGRRPALTSRSLQQPVTAEHVLDTADGLTRPLFIFDQCETHETIAEFAKANTG
jgi:hypothetical protein